MESRPRLSVELSPEQYKQLGKLIPWGQQRILFSKIVDNLIEILTEHGSLAIGAILAGRVKFLDIIAIREGKNATSRPKA